MLVYILKTAACLAILLVFYKLFLEKESIHKFKRFYLLGVLVFSLIVPALVFTTEYVVVDPPAEVNQSEIASRPISKDVIEIPQALEADVIDIAPVLWGIYFLGLFFFGIKFIRNLFQIFKRIRKNPKFKLNRFTQVLLEEKITPHTFFKYIFLNKTKFESKQIPKEVLLHEETHAQQKHSWDVVFVELLQVIFWVNPFIYLAKKAIKLNHEFLADQAVLQKNIDQTTYKNTLLSYLSPDSEKKYQPLANAINYSSIKKRFLIMKTQTSKKAILLRSLLLLPLLALMLYGFSETKVETILNDSQKNGFSVQQDMLRETLNSNGNQPTELQFENWKNAEKFAIWIDEKHVPNNTLNKNKPSDYGYFSISFVYKNARSKKYPQPYQVLLYTKEVYENYIKRNLEVLEIFINSKGKILIKDQIVTLENMNDFFDTSINREKLLQVYIISEEESPEELPYKIENLIRKYDIPQITFSKSNTKFLKVESGANPKEISKYNKLAKSHNLFSDYGIRPRESEIREVKRIYSLMTEEQKRNAEIFPEYPTRKNHNGASKKQLAEYNDLAKKYNTMLAESKSIQIKKQDVDRLAYIYGLMSDEQKAGAEPFPNFPEPPPPPKAPRGIKGEASTIVPSPPSTKLSDEEFAKKVIEETIANQDPYDQLTYRYKVINGKVATAPTLSLNEPRGFKAKKEGKSKVPQQTLNYHKKDVDNSQTETINYNDRMTIYRGKEGFIGAIEVPKPPKSPYSKKIAVENSAHYVKEQLQQNPSKEAKGFVTKNGKQLFYITSNNKTTYYNKYGEVVDEEGEAIQPPIPPTPPSPLEHIIAMAKEGAIFKYKGKTISSDQAIDLIKNNEHLSISTKRKNNETPIVKISRNL